MKTARNVRWSYDQLTEIAKLWGAGKSLLQIGLEFGVSRSCIAGIVSRNHLTRNEGYVKPRKALAIPQGGPVQRKVHPPRTLPPRRPSVLPVTLPAAVSSVYNGNIRDLHPPRTDGLVNLWDLTEHSCRWPEGDGPFAFCGMDVGSRKGPYCDEHHARAFVPGSARSRS